MAWRIGPITLGDTSVVSAAPERHDGLDLDLYVTSAERDQLLAHFEDAGMIDEIESFLGGVQLIDGSPDGRLVVYIEPDTSLVSPGWYICESCDADWSGSTTMCKVTLSFRRIGGPHAVAFTVNATTTFETHDF